MLRAFLMASFFPAYFQLLTPAFADRVPSERLLLELTRGIEAMDANEGSGPTNGEAFEAIFSPIFSVF